MKPYFLLKHNVGERPSAPFKIPVACGESGLAQGLIIAG